MIEAEHTATIAHSGIASSTVPPGPVLLYDGVCALCNGVVRFVIRHDRAGILYFASLQSAAANTMLGQAACTEDGVAVVLRALTPGQMVLRRSDAVVEVLRLLGWARAAGLLQMVPRPVREFGYRLVARVRYRWFGRYSVCPLPPAGMRERFLSL